MATTRRYLDITTSSSTALFNDSMPITPINVNCLDPLGRSALSIGLFSLFYFKIEIYIYIFFLCLFLLSN
jgi:hypothetical protein